MLANGCPETMRAILGIEPRTSRTLSENHTTRPNSQSLPLTENNKLKINPCEVIESN